MKKLCYPQQTWFHTPAIISLETYGGFYYFYELHIQTARRKSEADAK